MCSGTRTTKGYPAILQQTSLPGTSDRGQEELTTLQTAQRRLQALLASYGYREIDVPVLERTDLYLRKLGSRLAGRMFTFLDQSGERLCLRPEFTGSVIRSYIDRASELALPVRWQYSGPVFRDGLWDRNPRRQYTQVGAELIGSGTRQADAELLALACQGMTRSGISKARLLLGHAGVLSGIFNEMGLSLRTKRYLTSHTDLFSTGDTGLGELREGLRELQLTPYDEMDVGPSAPNGDTMGVIQWFLQVEATRPTGRRTSEDIIGRFKMKQESQDSKETLERALKVGSELSAVCASPDKALKDAAAVGKWFELDFPLLGEIRAVLDALDAHKLDGVDVQVDFGLTRPLGYYTGIIFELHAGPGNQTVGGGGRYDDLVSALGGERSVPALGFAYTLEDLLAASAPSKPEASLASVLIVPESEADFPAAAQEAARQRAAGQIAELEVEPRSDRDRQRYCKQKGIGRVLVVATAGIRKETVVK